MSEKENKEVNLHKRIAMGSQTDGTHLKHGGCVTGALKRAVNAQGFKKGGSAKGYKKGGKAK